MWISPLAYGGPSWRTFRGRPGAGLADLAVEVLLAPAGLDLRLADGQVRLHVEPGDRQVQRLFVGLGVGGHRGSIQVRLMQVPVELGRWPIRQRRRCRAARRARHRWQSATSAQPSSRSRTPRTIVRSLASASLATAMISSMLTGCRASGRHMSVTIEKPEHLQPGVDGHQDLGDGRHPHHVGPDGPEEAVLGPGLQVRAGHRHIDTAMGHDVLPRAPPAGPDSGAPGRRARSCRGIGGRAARRWGRSGG